MFFNADDDEQDFMSTGGSKLANLFGMDKASGQGGNASLTYTAPKQPKKKDATPEGGTAPVVLVAGIVHAYKYIDNKYASQGKLGAALLLTQATKDYRVLLYVNRQQQVTNAKITSAFSFNIQQNNYASFYDDARQMWSIMFDTPEAAEKFAKEIALAKANSGPQTDLIQQDLTLGDGGSLETGDSAEVKYTGWLLTNGTFGKVFDQSVAENYFRFRVGKGKVIKGWDQGMIGMKKGAKRLLIIPPSLAYSSQGVGDRVPPNATLIFEVHVVRVKLQKGESPQDSPAPTPLPTMAQLQDQDEMDDPGVKGRSRSINEHLSQSPDTGKAKLISRMARMGQPMLPFQGAVVAQPEDSDEDMQQHQMQQQVPASMKPALPSKPRSSSGVGINSPVGQVMSSQAQPVYLSSGYTMDGNQPMVINTTADLMKQQQQPAFLQNLPGAQQLAVYQNPQNFLQQQQQQQAALIQHQQQLLQQQQQQLLGQGLSGGIGTMPGQVSAYGVSVQPTQTAPQNPSSSADALAPVLLTETRQQNTEVRLGLSKMSDKVDKILDRVEHMNAAGLGAHALGMMSPYGGNLPAPSMEANVLMQNVSRIVQENDRLKKEVYEQGNKVQELNEKISNLLERNQKYVEQSQNLLEQRNEGYKSTASQSQAKVLALEQEKVLLATDLGTSSAQITTLQLELAEYRKREGELKQQLASSSTITGTNREELERLRLQKEEDELKINSLNVSVRDEKLARKAVEAKLAGYQEELSEVKIARETLEKSLSERKRKAAEDRRKLEEDLEDSKINSEKTIEDLREKLRRQKTAVDADTQSKMSKIEDEISNEWQAKSERMLAATVEKSNRQLADLAEEKEELIRKVEELEKKLLAIRSSGTSTEQQVTQLQDELAEMKLWKDKYETLRAQAAAMKERYDKRIQELEGEKEEEEERRNEVVENAREQRQELQQKIQQLQHEVQHLRVQLTTTKANVQQTVAPAAPSVDVATEIKKIMNSVFQSLRVKFDVEENYQGSEVLATILNVVKQTTLRLVRQSSSGSQENRGDDDGEEEEEEEEEEEVVDIEDEEEISDKESEAEDEVDEPREIEVTTNKVESSVSALVKTVSFTENEKSSSYNQVQTERQVVDSVDHQPTPPPTHSSDSTTADKILPPLDNTSIDENKTTDRYNTVGDDVPPSDDDSFLDDNSDNDIQDQSNPVTDIKIQSSDGSGREAALDNGQANLEESEIVQVSTVKEEEEAKSPSLNNNTSTVDKTIASGEENTASVSENPASVSENPAKEEKQTEETSQTNVKANHKPVEDTREPPPLFDDEEEEDSPLFGNDSTVSDTLGSAFNTKPAAAATTNHADLKPTSKTTSAAAVKDKVATGKKTDPVNDEDMKPQPPPPLFGDDSDDDDLDWLS